MIKVHKHLLTCDCRDCAAMFPSRRFEAVWVAERPEAPSAPGQATPTRAVGQVPIGHARPALEVGVWVAAGRLATDWPGFPGTLGAHVELVERGPGQHPLVVGTRDPILAALAPPVPLRRALVDRFNARSMVEHGLAPEESADFVSCARHGHGVGALTCACLLDAARPEGRVVPGAPLRARPARVLEVVLVYGLDGDFPDLFCADCFARYAAGDVSLCQPVCSRCQREHLYQHRLGATTWYGA